MLPRMYSFLCDCWILYSGNHFWRFHSKLTKTRLSDRLYVQTSLAGFCPGRFWADWWLLALILRWWRCRYWSGTAKWFSEHSDHLTMTAKGKTQITYLSVSQWIHKSMWRCLHLRRVPTFEQSKFLFTEVIKGIVSGCKDGVGAFLLQQIGQTCCLNQRQKNPKFVKKRIHVLYSTKKNKSRHFLPVLLTVSV